MKILIATLFTVAALRGNAQKILTPASHCFEKKWVKNEKYQMVWYALKDTVKIELGKVVTEIIAGKQNTIVVTTVNLTKSPVPWVDSTVAENGTLKPIHHSSFNARRDMVLDFGAVVSGFYKDKIKKTNTVISDTTNTGYFDSNIYPTLVRWLPLKQGYSKDIAIYDHNLYAKSGVLKASIKSVAASVFKTGRLGVRDVWIVRVTDEIGNGENGGSVYYIDKSTRELWQQEVSVGEHKMVMEKIE